MRTWDHRKAHTAIVVLAVCLFTLPLAAEQKGSQRDTQASSGPTATFADSLSLTSRKDPIHIRSHDLEFFYAEKRIQYRGNVVVVQGDMTLKSDILTVTYEDPAPAEPSSATTTRQRLKQIIAEGHVEITAGERRATSRKAVFNEAKRTVTLSGKAVLQEGTNRVTGEVVRIFLDEKRSVVEGGKGERQAQMVLIPQ